jgi:hypothetical protein
MAVEGVERMFSISSRTRSVWCAALLVALAPVPGLAGTPFEKPRFRIAAGAAAESLAEFSRQAHLQLLFDYEAVQGVQTQAVHGALEAEEALKVMLGGTHLTFAFVNHRTVSIVPRGSEAGDAPGAHAGTLARSQDVVSPQMQAADRRNGVQQGTGGERAIPTNAALLQEIIVSAEKRDSALQRTALAVSVNFTTRVLT